MPYPVDPTIGNLFPNDDADQRDARSVNLQTMGLTETILLWRDQVVDGKNRQAACEALVIDPVYERLPDDMTWHQVLEKVAGRNAAQLRTTSQLAMAGARMVAACRAYRASPDYVRPPAGQKEKKMTPATVAEMIHVSSTYISRALVVLRTGNARLIADLEEGRIGLVAAAALANRGAAGVQAQYDNAEQRAERERVEAERRAARNREQRRINQNPFDLFRGRGLPRNSRHWVDRPDPIPAPSTAARLEAVYPGTTDSERLFHLLEDANELARRPDFMEHYETRRTHVDELLVRLKNALAEAGFQIDQARAAIYAEQEQRRRADDEAREAAATAAAIAERDAANEVVRVRAAALWASLRAGNPLSPAADTAPAAEAAPVAPPPETPSEPPPETPPSAAPSSVALVTMPDDDRWLGYEPELEGDSEADTSDEMPDDLSRREDAPGPGEDAGDDVREDCVPAQDEDADLPARTDAAVDPTPDSAAGGDAPAMAAE